MLPETIFLDYPAFDELRKAMIGEAIANDDALRDCRQVRDRLLALVEKGQ